MNAETKIESASTDITVIVGANPAIVLTDRETFNQFYARMKAETDTLVPDTSTEKGRVAIRKMATRVRDTKVAIDKARLGLTEEMRDKISAINAAGKEIKETLQGLEDEVRQPLTEWEEAEKAREAECREVIEWLKAQKDIAEDDTATAVMARGHAVYERVIDPARFGDLAEEAEAAKDDAMATLKRAFDRLTKEEANRAELERLRAAEAERLAREQADREAREAEERAAAEAKAEEERRAAAEKAEQERIAEAREDAARAAVEEAERKAAEDLARIEARKQSEIDAANERARRAEEAAQAERDRIAREQREHEEAAERERQAQAEREADRAYQSKVKREAKEALMTFSMSEDNARALVLAIIAKQIPHVSWNA